jgi:2-ketocyclohexanecarboxyl-CoA hydrolase
VTPESDATGLSVLREERGSVLWLRLNRPERRNAYDEEMAESLVAGLSESHAADAVVITGNGTAFCAGGSLAALADPDEAALRRLFSASLRLFDEIRRHPRPVIAAVNGAAAGGGNELVIACDLAIAAESATFGQTGPRVGSAPVLGGTNVLSVVIGEKRAKEMAFLCRRYTAAQALELGLVNAVVSDADLDEEVGRWTAEVQALSPRYLEIAKASSNIWWNACRDSFTAGLGMLIEAIGSEDMVEGARAFAEKRAPRFRETR